MRNTALLILISVFVFSKAAFTSSFPPELAGHWKHVGAECKAGLLSKVGKSQLPSAATEQIITISSNGDVEDRMLEYGGTKNSSAYCETIYKGHWAAQGGVIAKPMTTLESRKGVGGYNCYKASFPKVNSADRDWPYSVVNGKLKITHQDLPVLLRKAQGVDEVMHICESGGLFEEVYERQL